MSSKELAARALQLGLENRSPEPRRIAITGFAMITAFGGTESTWQAILNGDSSTVRMGLGNHRTDVAAPLPESYNPYQGIDRKEAQWLSRISAAAVSTSREAAQMAKVLDENLQLDPRINLDRAGSWVSSGYASSDRIVDIHNSLFHKRISYDDPISNQQISYYILQDIPMDGSNVRPRQAMQVLPEQLNADVCRNLGFSGWGGNSIEACATGLSNPAQLALLIRHGYLDIGVGGGYEDLLTAHPAEALAIFASFDAMTKRNQDPTTASRPYDRDRDGFVLASGGGTVVLEEWEHAKARGTKIYGEVLGFSKSMDGKDRTTLFTQSQNNLTPMYVEI
jgi:3-oxoacyl-[acyl-carrier-protein] synthase II